jgi:hypothetical protein
MTVPLRLNGPDVGYANGMPERTHWKTSEIADPATFGAPRL